MDQIERRVDVASIRLSEQEIDAAVRVLRSGALRQGRECDAFEAEFAAQTGARHAVTSANGSAALHLAYMAFLQPGDEVLVPSFTFIATASMVSACGGVPVFCDIDPRTYLIDLDDARRKITKKTRAISPVHLFGNVVDPEAVQQLAREHDLVVVWDAAQAHGARFDGRDVGSFPGFAAYSFYPSKNLFVGEGGITLTDNPDWAHKMRYMRSHGQTGKYYHTMFGLNYRMTDVEAAIGREQLKRLDDMLAIRRRNAAALTRGLAGLPGITPQQVTPGAAHAWHQYCITVDPEQAGLTRDQLQKQLNARNIGTGVHYPRGVHQQPIYVEQQGAMSLPVTERVADTILALPVHHGMDERDPDYVAQMVAACLR
ncbi:MAG: DegT/DnrJ/EryC1/StrS family aminotransferase [Alphaproteobacteria bacterium]|nr:DegT/DnrJ/EryC1/StrS family aminotransferase [Alphaproteobacteria bacterium]